MAKFEPLDPALAEKIVCAAQTESYESVARDFGVSSDTVCKYFRTAHGKEGVRTSYSRLSKYRLRFMLGPAKTAWTPSAECLEVSRRSYPSITMQGKKELISRLMLSWKIGRPLYEGECALHDCDNPRCIRPEHLSLGSREKNNRDMKERGRSSRGSERPLAKLTEAQAVEIRTLYKKGEITENKLASRFGVSSSTIHRILSYESWRHV